MGIIPIVVTASKPGEHRRKSRHRDRKKDYREGRAAKGQGRQDPEVSEEFGDECQKTHRIKRGKDAEGREPVERANEHVGLLQKVANLWVSERRHVQP